MLEQLIAHFETKGIVVVAKEQDYYKFSYGSASMCLYLPTWLAKKALANALLVVERSLLY